MNERFTIEKTHRDKKPWMVVDNAAAPAEDPVLYFFSSKRKAVDFKSMLEDGKARGVA